MVNEEEERRLASERRIMLRMEKGNWRAEIPYIEGKFVFVVRLALAA